MSKYNVMLSKEIGVGGSPLTQERVAALLNDQRGQILVLGNAIGQVLAAANVITSDHPLSGPMLVSAAQDYVKHLMDNKGAKP